MTTHEPVSYTLWQPGLPQTTPLPSLNGHMPPGKPGRCTMSRFASGQHSFAGESYLAPRSG